MTDATPGQKELASRIADETIPEDSDAYDDPEALLGAWYVARDAALAAIIETQRLDSELADNFDGEGIESEAVGEHIAAIIRAGQHYGKDTDQ